jgi:hypothetical protein
MQQVANAVAEVVQRFPASVADVWPFLPSGIAGDRRWRESEY